MRKLCKKSSVSIEPLKIEDLREKQWKDDADGTELKSELGDRSGDF